MYLRGRSSPDNNSSASHDNVMGGILRNSSPPGANNTDSTFAFLKNASAENSTTIWKPPVFDTELLKGVVVHAKNLSEQIQSFIYIMFFNNAYRNHVANWLCNTVHFQDVHRRTLFISTSNGTCESLRDEWGEALICVHLAVNGYDDSLEYASRSFNDFMLLRGHLILQLAKSSIPLVLIESDAIWFRDPFPLFEHHFKDNPADTVTPLKGGQEKVELRSMSPMVLRPTARFVQFWKKLLRRLETLAHVDDQTVYNRMCLMRIEGYECGIFYYEDIADGKWYYSYHILYIKDVIRPYIINNNYVIGPEKKEKRVKNFGYWFLDEDGRCNETASASIIEEFNARPLILDFQDVNLLW